MRRGGKRQQAIKRWLLGNNKGKEAAANIQLRDSCTVCDSCHSEQWACEGGWDSWLGHSKRQEGSWHCRTQNKQQNRDAQKNNHSSNREARISERCHSDFSLGCGHSVARHKLDGILLPTPSSLPKALPTPTPLLSPSALGLCHHSYSFYLLFCSQFCFWLSASCIIQWKWLW